MSVATSQLPKPGTSEQPGLGYCVSSLLMEGSAESCLAGLAWVFVWVEGVHPCPANSTGRRAGVQSFCLCDNPQIALNQEDLVKFVLYLL